MGCVVEELGGPFAEVNAGPDPTSGRQQLDWHGYTFFATTSSVYTARLSTAD